MKRGECRRRVSTSTDVAISFPHALQRLSLLISHLSPRDLTIDNRKSCPQQTGKRKSTQQLLLAADANVFSLTQCHDGLKIISITYSISLFFELLWVGK